MGIYKPKGKKRWYIRYKDETGRWRDKAGYTQKAPTEQLHAKILREVQQKVAGVFDNFAVHRCQPIEEHLDEFYRWHKETGVSEKQRKAVRYRLEELVRRTECKTIADLELPAAEELLRSLTITKLLPDATRVDTRKPTSQKTKHEWAATFRQFGRWLHERRRLPHNPFVLLRVAKGHKATQRKNRRPLTYDEFHALVRSARDRGVANYRATHRDAPVSQLRDLQEIGNDRADLYLTLGYTACRVNELRTLVWGRVHLDDPVPHLVVAAKHAKNRSERKVPLLPWIVDLLRLRRPRKLNLKSLIFPRIPRNYLEQFYKDLGFAGIARVNDLGQQLDVHSLRGTTSTLLETAGVSLKVAQMILGHSDISMTAEHYTQPDLEAVYHEMRKLQAPPGWRIGARQK